MTEYFAILGSQFKISNLFLRAKDVYPTLIAGQRETICSLDYY